MGGGRGLQSGAMTISLSVRHCEFGNKRSSPDAIWNPWFDWIASPALRSRNDDYVGTYPASLNF